MSSLNYPKEKFSVARSTLMLPHPRGEASSISSAFHEISLGLADLDKSCLDDDARRWIEEIEELGKTDGIDDPDGKGLWLLKAESRTGDQKRQLSLAVDSMCAWLDSMIRR